MPGRNDPCPCGSGKKYKKCCLHKDEEARRAQLAAERAAQETAFAPLWPLDTVTKPIPAATEAGDDLEVEQSMAEWEDADDELATVWEEFEAEEDHEGQIAIFQAALDAGLLNDGTAFEMLDIIYEATASNDERDRFDALVAQLRQRLPDVYAHDAHFYLDWLISNALIAGRLDALPALVDQLADLAGAHLDIVNRVFDQLAYYDQLPVLAAGLRRAWPSVQHTDEYFQWAVSEFSEYGLAYTTLDYLEHTIEPNLTEMEAIGAFFECKPVQPDAFAQFLAHLTGKAGRRWTPGDLDLMQRQPHKGASEPVVSQGRLDFYYLTVEFLDYLRREEGVSYAKGELARDQIQSYLLKRYDGELKAASRSRTGKKNKSKAGASQSSSILLPDHASLDRYLMDLLNPFSPRPHRLAALFEMIPAWLRFLETRGLIDAEQHAQTLDELGDLSASMAEFWESYSSEPAPRLAAERWPNRVPSDL